MLIVGAGNLGIHSLEILVDNSFNKEIIFFDKNWNDPDELLLNKYQVINSMSDVEHLFKNSDKDFFVGIGNPRIRKKITDVFENLGGNLSSIISRNSSISPFNADHNYAGMFSHPYVCVAHSVNIGKSCHFHACCTVAHHVILHDYVSIATNVSVLGPCEIGSFTFIGANSVVLPNVKIGRNAIIAASSCVDRNIIDYETFINR